MTTTPPLQPDEQARILALAQRELWLNIARQAMKMVRLIERSYSLVPEKKGRE